MMLCWRRDDLGGIYLDEMDMELRMMLSDVDLAVKWEMCYWIE